MIINKYKIIILKSFVLVCFCTISALLCKGQSSITDSLKKALLVEKTDTGKAKILYNLGYYYQIYKPDSALLLAEAALKLSEENKFLKGQSNSLDIMGGAFNKLGNFSKALENYLEELKIEEKRGNPENIASVYLNIALVYNSQKDADKALQNAFIADSIVKKYNYSQLLLYTLLNIGDIYENNNQLDSALKFTKLCYSESVKQKNDLITGTALNNTGNIFIKLGKHNEALKSYRESMPYLIAKQDYNTLAECNLGLAKAFDKLNFPDSALYYADRSYRLATDNQFLRHAINASEFLSQLYKQLDFIDSAFAYQAAFVTLKDSFNNSEKIKQLQNLTISEQVRQQELSNLKVQQNKDRRLTMELLLIGIFIPILFFISAYLTRKKVHRKLIKFSGIFSLLFLFEYITLLVTPVVAKGTGHSPLLELLIFIIIAAIISPAHHKIEAWLISRLTKMHETNLHVNTKEVMHDEIKKK